MAFMQKLKATLKYIFYVVVTIIAFFAIGDCFENRRYEDVRKWGEGMNPNSYVFHVSRDSLKRVVNILFHHPSYKDSTGILVDRDFRGISTVRWRSENMAELRYGWQKRSCVYSDGKGKLLLQMAEYNLYLDSLAPDRTRVLVHGNAGGLSVQAGDYFFFNPRAGRWGIPNYVYLPLTTIEEYEFLKYIGIYLGENKMPAISYPSMMTYGLVKECCVNGFYRNYFPIMERDMSFGE